jgi:tetratricopeptide (TPR) repeat protein
MSNQGPKKKPGAAKKTATPIPPPLPDRRAMEQVMAELRKRLESGELEPGGEFKVQDLLAGRAASAPRTPLEEAQELMYQAWSARSTRQRGELARQALAISPDCADAYVLLAEESARGVEEALSLYEQGVKAGERALGPKAFREDVGYFWGLLETRPYMRARAGLAACLWRLGRRSEAIEHYTDMLRLNPNDNQGIRYLLTDCLLLEGDDKALGELLAQYEGDWSANWSYTTALWTFRQQGASPQADEALRKALDQNRYVPPYLLGRKRLPSRQPEYIGIGDEREAVSYAADAVEAWRKTPGALEWLARHAGT